jgi:hypothetical protein
MCCNFDLNQIQTNGAFFKIMSYPKVGFPHGCIGMIYTKNYTPYYSTPSYSGHKSKYYFYVLPQTYRICLQYFPLFF